MKKQKDLLSPTSLEEDFQREFMNVISTTATKERVKEKIIPTMNKIRKKLEKKRT